MSTARTTLRRQRKPDTGSAEYVRRSGAPIALVEETPERWRIETAGIMRVPGIVYASRALLPDTATDRCLDQVVNVASLPGIVEASYAMPDVHWGYGFPIGGVAATNVEVGGVISPGGVGFDISCGVRLLVASLERKEIAPVLSRLMNHLMRDVPHGAGPGGVWRLGAGAALDAVLVGGARYGVRAALACNAISIVAKTMGASRAPTRAPSALAQRSGAACRLEAWALATTSSRCR